MEYYDDDNDVMVEEITLKKDAKAVVYNDSDEAQVYVIAVGPGVKLTIIQEIMKDWKE